MNDHAEMNTQHSFTFQSMTRKGVLRTAPAKIGFDYCRCGCGNVVLCLNVKADAGVIVEQIAMTPKEWRKILPGLSAFVTGEHAGAIVPTDYNSGFDPGGANRKMPDDDGSAT